MFTVFKEAYALETWKTGNGFQFHTLNDFVGYIRLFSKYSVYLTW